MDEGERLDAAGGGGKTRLHVAGVQGVMSVRSMYVQARCMFNRFPRRAVTANGAFRAVLTIDSDDNIMCEGHGQAGRGAALFRAV